jgi:hypothetical protein
VKLKRVNEWVFLRNGLKTIVILSSIKVRGRHCFSDGSIVSLVAFVPGTALCDIGKDVFVNALCLRMLELLLSPKAT